MSAVKSKAKLSISPTSIGSNGVANRIDASSSTGSGGFVASAAQERHRFAQHYEKQLSQTEPLTAVDQVQPRYAADWFAASLLIETSGRMLASLAFEKTKTSGCAEDASFAGRGKQAV